MENEIKRGDYVVLAGSLSEFHPNIIDKLYDQHRGRIGLVRAVKYVPGYANRVAEVIFSGVPYISEVPVIHLRFIGKREEWPLRTRRFPEPNMTVVNYSTLGITKKVRAVFFNISDCELQERCYFEDGKVDILTSDTLIRHGCPEVKLYYDCGYAPQYVYHDYINATFTQALADLLPSNQNSLKGESTMKNTNKKPTPSNPIKQVIFNGPATIVYWNDGCKTVVKYQDVDTLDPEKGLAMAITKHYLCDICGLARYDGIFKKYLPKEEK